jgi:hypothetical protein
MESVININSYTNFTFSPSNKHSEDDLTKVLIKNLAKIPNGWDFGSGYPPSEFVISKALQVYSLGKILSFKVEVKPETEGGIILTLYKKDEFLDVIINNNLSLDIVHEKGIGIEFQTLSEQENVDLSIISNKLKQIKKSIECTSSEHYTLENIVLQKDDSEVIVSKNTVKVSPYSMKNAQLEYRVVYASI